MSDALKEVNLPRDGKVIGTGLALVYSKNYQIDLGGIEGQHPFDIRKYEKIFVKLVEDGVVRTDQVFVPEEITENQIRRVHSEAFVESLKSSSTVACYLEAPAMSALPCSVLDQRVLRAFRYATGGTLLAARKALELGSAINVGGGYHHAKPEAGEGFCVYADVPIAIRLLQDEGKIERALVIDLDVHQGNGTVVCLDNDPTTYTFSIHQGDIYPHPKEVGDEDVEVCSGMGDEEYLAILDEKLPALFDKARPDIVFFVAGCDVLAGDPLASLTMTHEGLVKRDRMVLAACRQRQLPVVMLLSGGYSKDAWEAQYKSLAAILADSK